MKIYFLHNKYSGKYLLFIYLILLLYIVIGIVILFNGYQKNDKNYRSIADVSTQKLILLGELRRKIALSEVTLLTHVINKNRIQNDSAIEGRFKKEFNTDTATLAQLNKFPEDSTELSLLAILKTKEAEKFNTVDSLLYLSNTNKNTNLIQYLNTRHSPVFTSYFTTITQLQDYFAKRTKTKVDAADKFNQYYSEKFILHFTISGLSFLLLGIFINRNMNWLKKQNDEILAREQLLSIEKKKFENLLDAAPDGMVGINNNGEIVLFNKQAELLFGYSFTEIVSKQMTVLLPNEFQEKYSTLLHTFTSLPESKKTNLYSIDFWGIKKNGQKFPTDISLSHLQTINGQIIIVAIRDITEKKEMDNKLQQTMQHLQNANKELEQFAYIASHDLQEPLRTVSSFTELFMKEYNGKLSISGEKYLEFIFKSSNRMKLLVKGLLDYSRIGKEKQLVVTDCHQLVSDVLADLGASIQECNAHIHINPLPTIPAYTTEMRQLFQNIIGNAIKYRKKGVEPEIEINAVSEEKYWHFSIKDNGIGIKESDQEKVFIIFKRLHNHNEYEGTGIGLSHCKKIVELHGGKIWIDSVIDNGSTFNFTILKQ